MSNINETLEKFYETKQRIKELEEKAEKYKKILENELIIENKIKGDKYTFKRKESKNERINKKDCPEDIWKKYSKSSTYFSYEITKNKI